MTQYRKAVISSIFSISNNGISLPVSIYSHSHSSANITLPRFRQNAEISFTVGIAFRDKDKEKMGESTEDKGKERPGTNAEGPRACVRACVCRAFGGFIDPRAFVRVFEPVGV